jgi:hypothetical protein
MNVDKNLQLPRPSSHAHGLVKSQITEAKVAQMVGLGSEEA